MFLRCAIFRKVLLCALDLDTNLTATVIQIMEEQYLQHVLPFPSKKRTFWKFLSIEVGSKMIFFRKLFTKYFDTLSIVSLHYKCQRTRLKVRT